MSTRGLFTFTDEDSSWNVYKHHDTYPSGAADVINDTVKYFAWPLPRFEADAFAAAFCAAGKAWELIRVVEGEQTIEGYHEHLANSRGFQGGGVRLMPQGDPSEIIKTHCSDVEYRYNIRQSKNGSLYVEAFEVAAWEEYSETLIFAGSLENFAKENVQERV